MSFVLLGILNSQSALSPSPLGFDTFAWYDADDASTITESSGAVSQWNDKSGNGFHLSQATSGNQPNINTTTLNSKPVMRFEDFDFLQASTPSDWIPLHDGTTYFIAGVVKWDATSEIVRRAIITGAGGDRVGIQIFTNTTQMNTTVNRGVSGDPAVNSAFSYTSGNHDFISWFMDPDNGTASNRSSIQIDNATPVENNTATATPSSADSTEALRLGDSDATPDRQFAGSFAELIIATGANATQENLDTAKTYLQDKWGI